MEGALFTTPLPLSLLAADGQSCSICLEPYIEPSPHGNAESQAGEWAVRIDLVAESSSLRRCCGHVLGKKCLAAHLRSAGPWKRRCPLCRGVWFHETVRLSRAGRRSHRSQSFSYSRRAIRATSVAAGHTSRDRSSSPVHEKLQMQEGSGEVGRTLEQVEQTLRELYSQPADTKLSQ